MSKNLTHLNADGEAHMVDVSAKKQTARRAIASAQIIAQPETVSAIFSNGLKKGDALATARIAGIMAAKKTDALIPLCHQIALTGVEVAITQTGKDSIQVLATAETTDRTGVEMEALVAASTAALTLYDMAKAIDRSMRVANIQLEEKSGGKSGDYKRTKG
jgi:cyclic pyranopterin phosphate synthase